MTAPRAHLELSRTADLAAVAAFYETVGYDCEIRAGDRLLVATVAGEIRAAVRLCDEQGALVLRGMFVAERCRGRGVGTSLLEYASAEIGPAECWCVPYGHLVGFYAGIGFRVADPRTAPAFLADRLREYAEQDRGVTLMWRPADPRPRRRHRQ